MSKPKYRYAVRAHVAVLVLGKRFTGIVTERYTFGGKPFYHLVSDVPGIKIKFSSVAEANLADLAAGEGSSSENTRAWVTAYNEL